MVGRLLAAGWLVSLPLFSASVLPRWQSDLTLWQAMTAHSTKPRPWINLARAQYLDQDPVSALQSVRRARDFALRRPVDTRQRLDLGASAVTAIYALAAQQDTWAAQQEARAVLTQWPAWSPAQQACRLVQC